MPLDNKVIIITGAVGFIGSCLFKHFNKKNYSFILISSTFSPYVKKKNISYINKDNLKKISQILKNIEKIEYIFFSHGEINHVNTLSHSIKDHFKITKFIFDQVKYKDIKKIIYFGSSEEYGNVKSPISENDTVLPLTNYAKAKLLNTSYLIENSIKYKINTTVLRLFLVYGPGQKLPRLIPYLLDCSLNSKIANLKSINSVKDFLHINDLISIIKKIIISKDTNCEIYNIGSGSKISIKKVLDMFKKYYDLEFKISEQSRSSEISIQYPSLKKIKKVINFKINLNLNKGIKNLAR